jgi:hypothetical protein
MGVTAWFVFYRTYDVLIYAEGFNKLMKNIVYIESINDLYIELSQNIQASRIYGTAQCN